MHAEHAAEDVGCSSRWKWNDDAYRPAGKGLRMSRRRKRGQAKGQNNPQPSRHDAFLLAPACHVECARRIDA
jgi:hypothetical protein